MWSEWKIVKSEWLWSLTFCALEGDSFRKNCTCLLLLRINSAYSHKAVLGMLFPLFAVNRWKSSFWGCLLTKFKNGAYSFKMELWVNESWASFYYCGLVFGQIIVTQYSELSMAPTNTVLQWLVTTLVYSQVNCSWRLSFCVHACTNIEYPLLSRALKHLKCIFSERDRYFLRGSSGFLGGSVVKEKKVCLPMQEIWVQSLSWEDTLEKEMAIHSSILAWEISLMGETGRL